LVVLGMSELRLVSPDEEEALLALSADVKAAAAEDFWEAEPGLSLVRAWAKARRVGPYSLLGEALLQVMARVPPQVVLPPLGNQSGDAIGAASLNQTVASVAASGLAKGQAHRIARQLVAWPRSIPDPAYGAVGSGEGIAATYVVCQRSDDGHYVMRRLAWSALLVATEVDKLAALLSRRQATLSGTLRAAWSGEAIGETNATPDRRRHVAADSYRLGIVVHVQPGRGGSLLDDEEVAAGTPQRLLWLPARDPDIPDTAPATPPRIVWQPPREVRAAVAEIEARGMDDIGDIGQVLLPVCGQALAEIDRAAVARHRGEVGALDGHALLVREKAAAAIGIFLGHFEVTEEDWQLAGHLMRVSAMTREFVSDMLRAAAEKKNIARGQDEARRALIVSDATQRETLRRAKERILLLLRGCDGWLSRSELRRNMHSSIRDYFAEAIGDLLKCGAVIHRETSPGHGLTGAEYAIRQR
jgi:hypothetical protein